MEYKLASSTWGTEEIEAIQSVVDTGLYSMGERVSAYEKDFANFFNSEYCIMTSSGSTANLLMIAALFFTKDKSKRLKRGDEVIVPAVSWSTTYFPLQQYGLKVKFVDIDPETLNFNLDELKSSISESTRLILAVNLLGNPNNFDEINKIIGSKDIILLEDNCESMGAKFNSKFTGTYGLMGTFSSFFSHHIATMEGGCILVDDEEIYHILLSIRAHGWTRNLPEKNYVTGKKSTNYFDEAFKFVLPGYNVRPIEMSGAIGIEQLKKLPDFIKSRRENARFFQELFANSNKVLIQKEISESSWFGFSLILKDKGIDSRENLINLLTSNRIDVRPIVTGNFTKNTEVLSYFDYEIHNQLNGANLIENHGLFVGNHHYNLHDEINYLYKIIHNS